MHKNVIALGSNAVWGSATELVDMIEVYFSVSILARVKPLWTTKHETWCHSLGFHKVSTVFIPVVQKVCYNYSACQRQVCKCVPFIRKHLIGNGKFHDLQLAESQTFSGVNWHSTSEVNGTLPVYTSGESVLEFPSDQSFEVCAGLLCLHVHIPIGAMSTLQARGEISLLAYTYMR